MSHYLESSICRVSESPAETLRSGFCGLVVLTVLFGGAGVEILANEDDDGPRTRLSIPDGDIEVAAGDRVEIPVLVSTVDPLSMVSFSLEYESNELTFIEPVLSPAAEGLLSSHAAVESSFRWFFDCEDDRKGCEGEEEDEDEDESEEEGEQEGNEGPAEPGEDDDDEDDEEEEGWIQVSVVLDYEGRPQYSIPAGSDFPLIRLVFELSPDATEGELELEFTEPESATYEGNFQDGDGIEVHFNAVRPSGQNIDPDAVFSDVVTPEAVGTVLYVIGDIGLFNRGDANLDGVVDLGDPVAILHHLFVAGFTLKCPQAGDANVDAILDVSDVVLILGYLFLDQPGWSPSTVKSSDLAGEQLTNGCSAAM